MTKYRMETIRMFNDYDKALDAINEIRKNSEDIYELSNFLYKFLTDEEFANNNIGNGELMYRKLIEDMINSKEELVKNMTKLKRQV